MTDIIDVTLTSAPGGWTATVRFLDALAAVTGTGATASAALDAARELAQTATLAYALGQGQVIGPTQIVAIESHLRGACSDALYRSEHPTFAQPTPPTWGTDVSTFPDLDATFSTLGTQRVIAEAVARRLLTPLGGLFYDPSSGQDVRELLGQGFTPAAIYSLRSRISSEAEADERVLSADVALSFNPQAQSLSVRVTIQPASGPSFALVLDINKLSADLTVLALP